MTSKNSLYRLLTGLFILALVMPGVQAAPVRAAAGLETRTYVPEFSRWEINSPGEPGVCYFVGLGFASASVPPACTNVSLSCPGLGSSRIHRPPPPMTRP